MELNGRDTAAGWNASLLYTPLRNEDANPRQHRPIYRSQATPHLDGQLLAGGTYRGRTHNLRGAQVLTGGIAPLACPQ